MSVELGSAFGKIVIDTSGVNRAVASAQSAMTGFQNKMRSIGQGLTSVGKKMTMGLTLPIVGIGVAMAKTASDFESQLRIMEIAARDSGVGIDELRQYALKMGADTVFSASEAADAMTGLFKAGMNAEEVMGDMTGTSGALAAAMDLAAASDLNLAQAADAVSIAIATFGIETDKVNEIANSFVQAADASVAEVGDLTAALTTVGPTAAAFGWSLEDVNTALALLSERGIRGSEAGTALKSMMTNLMRPTDDVKETLDALGLSLYDAEGKMRSLDAIIEYLADGMIGLTEEQKNLAVQTLAGTYGMKAMHTLLAEGQPGWQAMEKSIAGAASAQEVANTRMDTFAGAMEALQGSIETFMIQVGTPLINDHLRPFVEWLTKTINKVQDLDPRIVKWGIAIAGVLAVAGPLLIVVGQTMTAIAALTPIITVIGTVIGLLVSPIGLLVAAIVGLALAWKNNWGGIQDITKEVVGTLSGLAGEFIQVARDLIDGFKEGLQEKWDSIKGWFEENFGGLVDIVKGIFNIGSPSRVFQSIGWEIILGLQDGMAAAAPGLQGAMKKIAVLLENTLAIGLDSEKAVAHGLKFIGGLEEGLRAGSVGALKQLTRLWDRMSIIAEDEAKALKDTIGGSLASISLPGTLLPSVSGAIGGGAAVPVTGVGGGVKTGGFAPLLNQFAVPTSEEEQGLIDQFLAGVLSLEEYKPLAAAAKERARRAHIGVPQGNTFGSIGGSGGGAPFSQGFIPPAPTPMDRGGGGSRTVIEIPVYLDGREITRVISPYLADELQRRGIRTLA